MIALIRLDKIGDLVSTLPVDEVFPTELQSERHWVIAKGLGFLPKLASPPRPYSEVGSREQFIEFLRQHKPRAAVVFYAPWWVSYHLWREGVRIRIGRRSQWHSFLFLNHSLRQSRSLSEKHEADYNADLLRFAWEILTDPKYLFKSSYGGKLQHNKVVTPDSKKTLTPILKLEPPVARQVLERLAISSKKFVVVHPGMAGSALNWPQSHWNELIARLVEKTTVVITGTNADEAWLSEIKPRWSQHPKVRIAQGLLDLSDLTALLALSSGLIAPSTGVLHIGASVGIPVVGMYPPLESQHPRRWGPRSRANNVTVLTPSVDCPAQMHCIGEKCAQFSCMGKISVDDVFSRAEKSMELYTSST